MAAGRMPAVPLCLPENYTTAGKSIPRGNMKLCSEGEKLLEEIGEDNVVVICITGPARSGKSYLLSKLVDNVSFEVGHEVFTKTTGIWAALSQYEGNGSENAWRLLLDAEGFGGVTDVSVEWNTKLFALCCLLSSVMIYNSKYTPNIVDLERLHFLANYSDLVWSASQCDNTFNENAPKFFWILRDVLLDPKESGFENWKDFFKKQVLVTRPDSNQTNATHNSVVNSINSLFPQYDVKAISPPSIDPDVVQNLDKPDNLDKIRKFLEEIKVVRETIHSIAPIKSVFGTPITGKKLLNLMKIYINELNTKCDTLCIRTCWDATVGLQLQEIFKLACNKLQEEVAKIEKKETPLTTVEINKKIGEASNKIKHFFTQNAIDRDSKNRTSYLNDLEELVNLSLESSILKNEKASRQFCQKKGDAIIKTHFDNISEQMPPCSLSEKLHLYNNVMKTILDEYMKATDGQPTREEIYNYVKNITKEKLIDEREVTFINEISKAYESLMKDIVFPVEENELGEKHDEAESEAFESCDEEMNTYFPRNSNCYKIAKGKINTLFEGFKEANQRKSFDFCESVMYEILQDSTLRTHMHDPSIIHFITYKKEDYYLEMYSKKAVGPAKENVERELKSKLRRLLEIAKEGRREAAITVGKYAGGTAGSIIVVIVGFAVPVLVPVTGVTLSVAAAFYLGRRCYLNHPYRHIRNQQQGGLGFQNIF